MRTCKKLGAKFETTPSVSKIQGGAHITLH